MLESFLKSFLKVFFHGLGWDKVVLYFVIAIGVCWLLYWLIKTLFAILRMRYLKDIKNFDSLTPKQRLDVVMEEMPEDKVCLQDYDSSEINEWVLLYHKYHTLVVAGRAYDLSELIRYEHQVRKYKKNEVVSGKANYFVSPDGQIYTSGENVAITVEQDVLVLYTTNRRHPRATIEFRDNSCRWPLVAELYDKALSLKQP